MWWFALSALAQDAPEPSRFVVTYIHGQDDNQWSLDDDTIAQGADWSTITDMSGARDALGIAGYAAAPRVTDDMVPLFLDNAWCHVRVDAGTVDVTGCPDPLAAVTREAVAKWKWQRDAPPEFAVLYLLNDGWRLGDECFFPFVLFGSGTPVLDNSGVAGCPEPIPNGDLMVPMMPEGTRRVACKARLTATADGVGPATVEGCPEPYASVVASHLAQWRFKAAKGEPTKYLVRLEMIGWPPR